MPTRTIEVPDEVNGISGWVSMDGLKSDLRTLQLAAEPGAVIAIEFSNNGVKGSSFVTLYGQDGTETVRHAGQYYRAVRKAGVGAGAQVFIAADEVEEGASGIRSGLVSISYLDFASLADGVTSFTRLVDLPLPSGARFVGAVVESFETFTPAADYNGVLGTPDLDCMYFDTLVSPTPSAYLNGDAVFHEVLGGFGLTIDSSDPSLNTTTAGRLVVRFFYTVPANT